jgi:hypothetical protein
MKKIAIALLLLASPVFAQEAGTAPDRVAVSLGRCVLQSEQEVDQIADLQKQLTADQARIKELEPKSDSAPPPNNAAH